MAIRRSEALAERLTEIQAELTAIEEQESGPTDDDLTRSTTLLDEFEAGKAEHERLLALETRMEAVRSATLRRNRDEDGKSAPNFSSASGVDTGDSRPARRGYSAPKSNPFENLDAIRNAYVSPTDMIARAHDAIEQAPAHMDDVARQRVTSLLDRLAEDESRQGPLIARHLLLTGSPEYHDAFVEYMNDPSSVQRASLSLTSANGGYLVPFTLDPSVILTNSGSANPFRQISNIKTTATNTWNGVTSAGMNAAWLAENTIVADASPTFSQVSITPQKASSWVYGSYEVLEDSDFASEIPGLLADAKDRLEEAAFCVGTGTGQPKGIVTAATTTVTATGTATYAVGDVYATQAAVPPRFRRNSAWIMSLPMINRTRAFDTAGGASFWTNLGQGAPNQLLGGDVYESTSMASVLTTGSKIAVYGDFSQYAIVDRIGMSVLYEPMVKGTGGILPSGQGGWFAFWRVGADALVPGAFRTLVTG